MSKREKKTDVYSVRSARSLQSFIDRRIKNVFKTALKCVEIKFGKDFEGYEKIRAEILRAGNDGIRQIKEAIDEQFNVEELPVVSVFEPDEQGRLRERN